MLRSRYQLFTSFFLVFLPLPSVFGQTIPPHTITLNQRMVVPMTCMPREAENFRAETTLVGSGFFINDQGYFVTTGQVLREIMRRSKAQEKCDPAIYVAHDGWDMKHPVNGLTWFSFMDCELSSKHDLGYCAPLRNPFLEEGLKKHLSFATFSPFIEKPEGTDVAFIGFHFPFIRPITVKGMIASYFDTENKFVISGTSGAGGNGSPVFTSDGTIIGLVSEGGVQPNTGLSLALPAEAIVKFLKDNKVPFTQKEPAEKPRKPR